ncbi:metal ABC transporter permease, partial [bacterium]|nr:metal ABC transporter permease [bacterium]
MIEILQLEFMQRALLAGMCMGLTLSLLGVFVVMKKSAFFGDAVSHFAFAGIALGFLFSVDPILAAVTVSLVLALGMGYVQNHAPAQSLDTIIGIFFSGAAALGIFIIGLLEGYRADLFQYLFGDIIAVSPADVVIAAVVAVFVAVLLMFLWKSFFRASFNRDIAHVGGVSVMLLDYVFLGLLAAVTAMSIKVVGIILVPALLVIPAAAAKNISQSFRQMIFYSAFFGVASVVGGLIGSFYLDTASGATIVLLSILFFVLTLIKG